MVLIELYKRRQHLKDARELLRESDRVLKRASASLKEGPRKDVTQAADALRSAITEKKYVEIEPLTRSLDVQLAKHLAAHRKGAVREYSESFGYAILAALFLRAFVFEAFVIPSGSMIPTLEINDKIFVNKYIYGLRVPFTFIKFFEWNTPKRGEVIVFIYPRDHSKDYIKRVVGLPGDIIEIKNDQLHINGEPVEKAEVAGDCEFWDVRGEDSWESKKCRAYTENIGGHSHRIYQASEHQRDFGPRKVEPGHVFAMGDNRDNSSDSRDWGFVPMENIKGRAMFIWFARSRDGFNPGRLLTWIE